MQDAIRQAARPTLAPALLGAGEDDTGGYIEYQMTLQMLELSAEEAQDTRWGP